MKAIDELNKVISNQIERVQNGLGINTEIALLEDLKRMSELGVLKVYTSNAVPEIKIKDNKTVVEYLQPRLMFTGEDEIKRLRNELEQLKKHLEALKEQLNANVITDNSKVNENLLEENRQLKEQLKKYELSFNNKY